MLKSRVAEKGKAAAGTRGESGRIPVSKIVDIGAVELRERAEAAESEFEALQGDWQGK